MGYVFLPEAVLSVDLSDGAFRCLAALSVYAREGDGARPKHDTLARRCRSSVPSVKRYLRELVGAKLIAVQAQEDDLGRPAANHYRLVGCAELHRYGVNPDPSGDGSILTPPIEISSSSMVSEGEAKERERTTLSTPPQNKSAPPPAVLSPLFLDAWSAYPRRPGNARADAWKQWQARVRDGCDEAVMVAGTRAYAAYCAREGREPRFIKLAATFFGPGRHFEAEYGPVEPAAIEPYLTEQDMIDGKINPAYAEAFDRAAHGKAVPR